MIRVFVSRITVSSWGAPMLPTFGVNMILVCQYVQTVSMIWVCQKAYIIYNSGQSVTFGVSTILSVNKLKMPLRFGYVSKFTE
jgi:hypothetical protein